MKFVGVEVDVVDKEVSTEEGDWLLTMPKEVNSKGSHRAETRFTSCLRAKHYRLRLQKHQLAKYQSLLSSNKKHQHKQKHQFKIKLFEKT